MEWPMAPGGSIEERSLAGEVPWPLVTALRPGPARPPSRAPSLPTPGEVLDG